MFLDKIVTSTVLLSALLCVLFPTQITASGLDMQTDSITAETAPDIKSGFPYKQFILPSALIAYGTIETVLAGKVKLINYGAKHEVTNHVRSKFRIGDITQYAPGAVYIF